MTLYEIGSFFPALAARDRVKLVWQQRTESHILTRKEGLGLNPPIPSGI
jgi:hypothetical protein